MEKGTKVLIGNFILSISKFNNSEVALLSKHTGEFVKLERAKTNKILRKVKRNFKHLTCNKTFCFWCSDHNKLINILKGK
jgi:hypothetical protein